MLTIKLRRLCETTKTPVEGAEATNILLHSDGLTMICTRSVRLRSCRVITHCNGTTGDFSTLANRVAQLSDELFEEFARLQAESMVTN